MTLVSGDVFRICSNTCSPSIPGSQMSSRTTEKSRRVRSERHSSPLETAWVSNPSSRRIPWSEVCTPFSSSTTRIASRFMEVNSDLSSGLGQGQIDDDSRAERVIRFSSHLAVMLRDYLAHNGQTQSGPVLACGEVREE